MTALALRSDELGTAPTETPLTAVPALTPDRVGTRLAGRRAARRFTLRYQAEVRRELAALQTEGTPLDAQLVDALDAVARARAESALGGTLSTPMLVRLLVWTCAYAGGPDATEVVTRRSA